MVDSARHTAIISICKTTDGPTHGSKPMITQMAWLNSMGQKTKQKSWLWEMDP